MAGLFQTVSQTHNLLAHSISFFTSYYQNYGELHNRLETQSLCSPINKSLHIACADEFVSELDGGIDSLLGERGTGLSEGQMQRIAIAWAIFSDSLILLLDEAASVLDADTEKRLLQNLRSMTDKTVVIVTHRPAALEICDRVIDFTNIDGSEERIKQKSQTDIISDLGLFANTYKIRDMPSVITAEVISLLLLL